jgi:hypothetical protein
MALGMAQVTALDPTQIINNILAVAVFFIIIMILLIALYIYSSWALMAIAIKAKAKYPWLAWIPIGNLVLTANIEGMHGWPVLLFIPYMILMMISLFVPVLTIPAIIFVVILSVYTIIWQWKMYEAVDRPGWWSIVSLIISGIGTIIMTIGTAMQSIAVMITGIAIAIAGAVISLILLGIAAWGKKTGKNKISSKKNNRKN